MTIITDTNSHEDTNDIIDKLWDADDYKEVSSLGDGIERAREVISNLMSEITLDSVEGLTETVNKIGNVVTEVRKAVMRCSIYQAVTASEHAAMAVMSDDIFTSLWQLNNDMLKERLSTIDTRRKHMRKRERNADTTAVIENSFAFSMYITSYEVLINATGDIVRGAASWHHHMSLMHDQLLALAQDPDKLDPDIEATISDVIPELVSDDLPDLETDPSGDTTATAGSDSIEVTSNLSDSSQGTRAQTVDEIVKSLTKPKSPIDV